ncbi:histidinol dehydrogenase [Parashewanella spongiae]|uniref:Histidinol dehydrogenase n=1 Tax=Parashewanella spongiae TaxID=342950 RepID=A0A3A6U4Y6_9GAMM|nr:histidinol dehydrogenase [Parashewanella spongiae]MCL1076825.1 histidinol dehydrogenase [Parashewanella spongiae]RJY19251.1 histidinol dehydrogenase [Parashewanella spongiae]
MDILRWSKLTASEQLKALSRADLVMDTDVSTQVQQLVDIVKKNGDKAVNELTKKYDNLDIENFKVCNDELKNASRLLDNNLIDAIQVAYSNINTFHTAQLQQSIKLETQTGISCELRTEAINSVGLYIPSGSAPLISTALMLAIPAHIAKCERIVLMSPPPIHPAILHIANVCGINEIYQIGGVQAIAALAYGTNTIKPVDKIFGPGNRYVTAAKSIVAFDDQITTTIDMPAGPSEVLVIADEDANPSFIAADLLSQAEHGEDSQAILITHSEKLALDVVDSINTQLANLSRQKIAKKALYNSRVIIVDSIKEAINLSNHYAPEHLIIQTESPREHLKQVRAAGSVFLGKFSPEAVGDYASGTNHVLPTYGYSRSVSSLTLSDFQRKFTVQSLTSDALMSLSNSVITLAMNEQLDGHANAIEVRKRFIEENR